MLTLKKRAETEGIHLYFQPDLEDKTLTAIEKEAKRNGGFNIGCHYIIRRNGNLEKGISRDAYASPAYDAYQTCVCVVLTTEKITAAQKLTLKNLEKDLALKVV